MWKQTTAGRQRPLWVGNYYYDQLNSTVYAHFLHLITIYIVLLVYNLFVGGVCIIVQKVVNSDGLGPDFAHNSELFMLAFGGKERTFKEYKDLLTDQGFTSVQLLRNEGTNFCDVITAKKL